MIYKNDNYKCIQTIKDAHENDDIYGFIDLKNNTMISYSNKVIKIWSF